MALWSICVEFEMIVDAESKAGAELVACDNAREDFIDQLYDIVFYPQEITEVCNLPESWKTAIPWGRDDDEMTCEQILDASKSAEQERQVTDG